MESTYQGWIKFFNNRGPEFGSDDMVDKSEASWSRGKLDEISEVSIANGFHSVTVHGSGNYWQSDDYEVQIGESHPSRILRRIQRQIHPEDRHIYVDKISPTEKMVMFQSGSRPGNPGTVIINHMVGMWFTVEMQDMSGRIEYSFRENKI